jgi:hypothetical protein
MGLGRPQEKETWKPRTRGCLMEASINQHQCQRHSTRFLEDILLRLGTGLEVPRAKKLLESTYTSLELVERALCKLMYSVYDIRHRVVYSGITSALKVLAWPSNSRGLYLIKLAQTTQGGGPSCLR